MKRKLLIMMMGLALLSACAHTRIASWEGDKFKVCGNKWAGQEDFEEVASNRCPAGYISLGGGEQDSGLITASSSYGVTSVRSHKEQCTVYQCKSTRNPQ